VIRKILLVHLCTYIFLHSILLGNSNENVDGRLDSSLFQLDVYLDQEETRLAATLCLKLIPDIEDEAEWESFTDKLIRLSLIYHNQGDFDTAIIFSKIADSIVYNKNFITADLKSRVYYLHGLSLYRLRNWEYSQEYFLKSHESGNESGNDSIVSLSLKSLGNVQLIFKDYALSLDYYKKSLETVNTRTNPSQIMVSSLYQNIGISYSLLNENDSALKYLHESLTMKEFYLSENDPMLASGYLNISRLMQLNGELNDALDYINKAEKIFLANYGEKNTVMAPFYFNKGSILISLSDYEEALHYHELALELYKVEFEAGNEIFPEVYLNFGVINSFLNQTDEAIKYFKLCVEGEVSMEQKVKGNSKLGLQFMEIGDFEKANNSFLISIEIAEKNLGFTNIQTAYSYLNYGKLCEQTNKPDLALTYYLKAADIIQKVFGNKNRDLSNIYTQIGNFFYSAGSPQKALDNFQKALVAFIDDFYTTDTYVNPEFKALETDLNLFYTLSGKSNAYYKHYHKISNNPTDLKVCLETAELAIQLLERIKFTLQGENTKLLVNSKASEIYDLAVATAAELYDFTGDNTYLNLSFTYSEKSKAAILLSSIKEMEALQVGNLPAEIKEREKQLKRSIAQYQNIIYEENQNNTIDSNKVSRLRSRLFETKILYDSLVASIELKYPAYYDLKYNFDVISIPQIQEKLESDHVFIEYKLTDSTLFTFVVKHDTVILAKTHTGNLFTTKVNNYLALINQMPATDSVSSRSYQFAELGVELTKLLELSNPIVSKTKKLIVIPDDILGYLSFDALITCLPKKQTSKYNKLDYLIYKHTLSYGYSGTLFFNKEREKVENNKVLAIAPSYINISKGESTQSKTGIRDLEKFLIPLPYTISEVDAILNIFKGNRQVEDEATESNFKSNSSDYGILHFAMHTLINDEEPMASKLVFTLNNDTIDDGFLNTYEIYNLDLQAELAVLSACRTGTGRISKGEGIMSLARGFLYAGVPGIIMTLWAVEDISGAEIITRFYENLYSGQHKDVALRNSKLSYLINANQLRAHPYFWAAYVQIGDNSSISLKVKTFKYYTIAASAIIVLIILLRIRRNKKIIKKAG